MTTTNVSAYVKYTAPKPPSGRPDIGFYSDPGCTKPWRPDPIFLGNSANYTLNPGGDDFDFIAISFWAKDKDGVVTQVARSFQQFKGGVANFDNKPYVTNVDAHSKSSISFTVTNLNDQDQSGYVSFQVTIEDSKSSPSDKKLYTSQDPQILLEKDP